MKNLNLKKINEDCRAEKKDDCVIIHQKDLIGNWKTIILHQDDFEKIVNIKK
jgi:hypothetical protein